MSDITVIKYLVKCLGGDGIVETDYRTSVPTVCPVNGAHSIDTAVTTEINRIENNTVTISDHDSRTQGNWQLKAFEFNVDTGPNVVSIRTTSEPIDVVILNLTIMPTSDNIGDYITVDGTKDFNIAWITQNGADCLIGADVPTGATCINISPALIYTLQKGYIIKLKNGNNENILGRCLAKDLVNSCIRIETPPITGFTIAEGTQVLFTVRRFDNLKITSNTPRTFGNSTSGGTFVPAGIVGYLTYKNMSDHAKTISFAVEMQY